MSYIPRPGSIAAHVCAWFKANPSRQLMTAQVVARFGGTAATVAAQLGAAEDNDFLLSEHVGRCDVWKAGPKLASWTPLSDSAAEAASFNPPASPPPAPPAAPAPQASEVSHTQRASGAGVPKAPARGARLPALDLTSIQVQKGTLMEPRSGIGAKGGSQYAALFDKLTEPNTWIELPSIYIQTLNKAVIKQRKLQPTHQFRCIKVSDTKCHLQRLEDRKPSPTGISRGQA